MDREAGSEGNLKLHVQEIARLVGGSVRGLEAPVVAAGISADSRTILPGQLFFALRGGHAFVDEAFRKGACAAVVGQDLRASGPLIRVDDTVRALGTLAGAVRLMLEARVIAVGGSNGKTTTKDMIAHVLGKDRRVCRSKASFNNDIGLPLTLLTCDPRAEFLVVELGTNRPGDIDRLAQWARPDAAVITSIAEEHLEGLGSVEGVAAEEASILRWVRSGGFAAIPGSTEALAPHLHGIYRERLVTFGDRGADVVVSRVERGDGALVFALNGIPFRLPLHGVWNAVNAAAACAVACRFGIPLWECAGRLADFRGPKMRMELLQVGSVRILNDAYNANPVSMLGAIDEFALLECEGRRIAVIGEMGELGDQAEHFHAAVGERLKATRAIDTVVTVGEAARTMGISRHFPSVEEARGFVASIVRPGDAVLLKGSRSVGLEQVVKSLAEKFNGAGLHAAAAL